MKAKDHLTTTLKMVENHRCILIFVKITFLNFTFVLFHCSGIHILKFTISNNRVSVLKYLFCSVHKCRFSDSGCSFQYSDSTHQIQVTKFNTGEKKRGRKRQSSLEHVVLFCIPCSEIRPPLRSTRLDHDFNRTLRRQSHVFMSGACSGNVHVWWLPVVIILSLIVEVLT